MRQRHRSFTLSDGTVIYGLSGSDGTDEDDEDDDMLDDDPEGGDEDDDEVEEDEESVEDLKAQLADALLKSADYERRMRMADRTAARYRTEAEALAAKKTQAQANGEVSKDDEITQLKAQLADRQSGDTRGKIRDEFALWDKHQFHNRKVAFDLLDISDVPVDDRGRVDSAALSDAIENLVRENPYLVKTSDVKTEDKTPKADRPSGAQPGAHRRDRKQVDRAALEKKFPQLHGRS